jgi:hypothetical protein
MWTINATVRAVDRCDENPEVVLVSVVSNQPDNGTGDGDTINDIQGVTTNTLDLVFLLRAERAGPLGERRYTATYRATDDSGNSRTTAAVVVVPHNQSSFDRVMSAGEKSTRGARTTGDPEPNVAEAPETPSVQQPTATTGFVMPIVTQDANSNPRKTNRKRKPKRTTKQVNALKQ